MRVFRENIRNKSYKTFELRTVYARRFGRDYYMLYIYVNLRATRLTCEKSYDNINRV